MNEQHDHDARYLADTHDHIDQVRRYLYVATAELTDRARAHDASKLEEPERSIFRDGLAQRDRHPYGSDGYFQHLLAVKPALDHHYAHNRHHPEHHADGVSGMDLFDLVEMVCDWMAACEGCRPATAAQLGVMLEKSQARFGYSDDIAQILAATVCRLYEGARHTFAVHAGGERDERRDN